MLKDGDRIVKFFLQVKIYVAAFETTAPDEHDSFDWEVFCRESRN
jgi:hypothetical protein